MNQRKSVTKTQIGAIMIVADELVRKILDSPRVVMLIF